VPTMVLFATPVCWLGLWLFLVMRGGI